MTRPDFLPRLAKSDFNNYFTEDQRYKLVHSAQMRLKNGEDKNAQMVTELQNKKAQLLKERAILTNEKNSVAKEHIQHQLEEDEKAFAKREQDISRQFVTNGRSKIEQAIREE